MSSQSRPRPLRVFMMDLWATVPYYTAYLSRALLQLGIDVQIGSITYYLDRQCFSSRGLSLDPGWSDQVGKRDLSRAARRSLKLVEGAANLVALGLRFSQCPPDIVHIQFLPLLRSRLPLDLWFIRFIRRRGARLVLTVHDLLPHDTGQQFRKVYADLYAEMDRLICHSPHIRDRLRTEFQVPESRIAVIPHGPFFYDLPVKKESSAGAVTGTSPGEKLVLWQGILFPYKGVDLLLDAWRLVEQQLPQATLVVLGTGADDLLASLEQHAKTLGLERVRFDFRFCSAEELVAAYRRAHVVVYPYRAITTSGALATGLSLGKAIVASDLPVFRELLQDGRNAILVDPTRPEELARGLLRVLEDDPLAAKLEDAVQEMHFGDQTWTGIAQQTEEAYEAALRS